MVSPLGELFLAKVANLLTLHILFYQLWIYIKISEYKN